MKAINIKYIILLVLLFPYKNSFANSRTAIESMDSITYFTLGNLKISQDGRWSSVTKQYKNVPDTLLIFDAHQKENPVFKSKSLSSFTVFLPDNLFFTTGKGKATLLDLKSKMTKEFDDVKEAGLLEDSHTIFILRTNGTISFYSAKGIFQKSFPDVEKLVTDKRKTILGISESKVLHNQSNTITGSASVSTTIKDLSDKQPIELYRTTNKVKRIQLTEQNSGLVIFEENIATSNVQLTFIDLRTKERKYCTIDDIKSFVTLNISELGNGNSFWIEVCRKVFPEKSIPDIWYGNDGDLKAKQYDYTTFLEFYKWNIHDDDALRKIEDKKFPLFASINRTDAVLALNPRVNFKYSTRVPHPSLYLYNIKSKTSKEIFSNALDTVVSADGKNLISYNSVSKKWLLYDTATGSTWPIEGSPLIKPVFDLSGHHVFFESDRGLWEYDLRKHTLSLVKETEGKTIWILNGDESSLFSEYHISKRTFDSTKSLLFKMRDENNHTSFGSYKNSNFHLLFADSSNHITDFKLTKDYENIFTIEENYNLPPRLYLSQRNLEGKQLVYKGNTGDNEAFSIRQEIVDFTNSEGVSLKGLLYYPLNFDVNVQYPMVVHIYQVRSTGSNIYYHGGDEVGFDVRALLRKGYFVYMPDIVYGRKGAARSALECVNSAMDALKGNSNINQKKIGLIGHSMGGYETNFIATQSKRFATYISGSAHSDLVRNYFSYSYHNYIPQIWRIETGQYEMGVSFAEDKEKYFKNSPIHFVDQVQSPILLWTGMKDENVKWEQTMEFFMGLKRFDKDVIALFYKDGDHTFYDTPINNSDISSRSLEWWDYFLKDKTDVPWISKQIKKDAW